MKKICISLILTISLIHQSVVFAAPVAVRCVDLFDSSWEPGSTPQSALQKREYLEYAIRSTTQNAFSEMKITDRSEKIKNKIEKYTKDLDFDHLTKNQLIRISSKINQLPFPVRTQLLLKLKGKAFLAEENLNTTLIANEIMNEGLLKFVIENGNLQDRDIRDHYMVYIRKYMPLFRLVIGSAFSLFSIGQVPALLAQLRSSLNSKFLIIDFEVLSKESQEDVLLNGLRNSAPRVRNSLSKKSRFALDYAIGTRILTITVSLIALAILIDELSQKYIGVNATDVYDDLFKRQYLESTAYEVISSSLIETGTDYDEALLRAQIHEMNLRALARQIKN